MGNPETKGGPKGEKESPGTQVADGGDDNNNKSGVKVDPNATGLTKIAQKWAPAVVSNLQSYYCQGDKTVVLNTDEFVIDPSLAFSTGTLLIYAERIRITSNVKLPGKTIGLFCHELMINTATGLASIDVSGDDAGQNPQIPAVNGNPAGTIVICVENFDDANFPSPDPKKKSGLYLRAAGGKGGPGENPLGSEAAVQGGKGGDGGECIRLRCLFRFFVGQNTDTVCSR